jgi:hypothetical protein
MSRAHNFPVPPGFTWDHVKDIYTHPDGRMWNSIDNRFFDKNGIDIPAPVPQAGQQGLQAGQQIDSASNDRTANNVMRHEYRVLTEDEKAQMKSLKDIGASFVSACDSLGASRELSLAKTNIEQAVMWAVKHLTK